MIQNSGTVLKEVAGEIIWSREYKKHFFYLPPFSFDSIFKLLLLCIIVIAGQGFCAESSWK